MPSYVRVRGLARRGIRVRSSISGTGNAVTVAGNQTVTLDLDDPKTRADISHHSAIGQLQVVDYVNRSTSAAASAGVFTAGGNVVPRSGSLVADVTPGTFVWNDAATLRTVTIPAQTVTFGANASGNPRTDFVIITPVAGGTTFSITVTAGTTTFPFGGAPAAPAAPVQVVAEVLIANNAIAPTYVLDRRPLI